VNIIRTLATLLTALGLAAGLVPTASAQSFTGRIDVAIEDSTGERLSGVSVELTGPITQGQTSDAQGQAHFLNLPVGQYAVRASLTGFNPYSNANVQVASGAATPINARLGAAGTAETVSVMAATPIIDVRRQTTTTNVTLEELQSIPTARDPGVVLQTVPTIYADRVNVGGSESGQGSTYIGKGSVSTDNTWSIDGVPVTDMGAAGSTSTYYDFDMLQEMAITTGGADAQNPTPGVQVNLVLKTAGNTPHGSTRIYFENEKLQGNNLPASIAEATGSTSPACVASSYTERCGIRTDSYLDWGFELGGPVLKDRIWAWWSVGRTEVTNLAITGQPDATFLKNDAFKADWQAASGVRVNFTFLQSDEVKNGRGVGPTRLIDTAWNQARPTKYFKGEGNFVSGQRMVASARYAYISSDFQLSPIGGLDRDFYKDDANIWHNSYYFYKTARPQYYVSGDASYFAGRHEVKVGFSWRRTPVESTSQATGHKIVTIWNGYPNLIARAQQDDNLNTVGRYTSGFLTDTISMNRLTVIAGIRFDHQTASLSATHADAVPNFPLLPAIDAQGVENAYVFKTLMPRVGVTYALDDSRRTLARASVAMFASQLPANAGAFISPIQPDTYVSYNAVDKNGNGVADLSEIDFKSGVQGSNNVDFAHPGVVGTSNRIGGFKPPKTRELMFGIDREVAASFGVSATVTYRYMDDFLWNPRNGITAASYTQSGTFAGTFANVGTVSIPYYAATGALPGFTAQNRPDYHRRYLGFEVSATKRMSNRWMARAGFGTASWNEYFDSPAAVLDKTPTATGSGPFANLETAGPLVNGGAVAVSSAGSGNSSLYLLPPKYQVMANGMYQARWGINVGASLNLRQGYGAPFFWSGVATGDQVLGSKSLLLAQGADQFRLGAVSTVDLRVEKIFKFGSSNLALDFDVFNLFNTATVLSKEYDARSTTYSSPLEIVNPRLARLGARFRF
jgi:hypothetical protein